MGLDTIELILEIEETFDIKIPDEVAQEIRTVDDLCIAVSKRLKPKRSEKPGSHLPPCLSAATFYEVRRDLLALLNRRRSDISPSTPIVELFPKRTRQHVWRLWRSKAELRPPELLYPVWVVPTILLLPIIPSHLISGLILRIALSENGPWQLFAILTFATWFTQGLVLARWFRPLATSIAGEPQTFGELLNLILRRNHHKLSYRHGSHGEEDIFRIVRDILAAQLGISPDIVVPSAEIVRDLGCD